MTVAIAPVSRKLMFGSERGSRIDTRLEWLVTNGLGGYASGPVFGGLTRRFHGVLIAALPAPFGRMAMLTHLRSSIFIGEREVILDHEDVKVLDEEHAALLTGFELESGLPIWRYDVEGVIVEKRIVMAHLQNTVHVAYRVVKADRDVRLRVQPMFHVRTHEGRVSEPALEAAHIETTVEGTTVTFPEGLPPLHFVTPPHASIAFDQPSRSAIELIEESARGYDSTSDLWTPGWIDIDLGQSSPARFVISTEPWNTVRALTWDQTVAAETERRIRLLEQSAPGAQTGIGAELTLAADQFVVVPTTRPDEVIAARASGDHARTVIAGYHWFTDWGRDTMISLEGLTLITGRIQEAGYILRTFGHHVRHGLIPNMFPEGERHGLYHTADATMWFFHAIDRYLRAGGERATLRLLLPTLVDIIEHHVRGTDFGIGVDPADGLLRQGADGYQLTWMDAKVDDWVVTPRRGKAVEINALWYAALRLLAGWLDEEGDVTESRACTERADKAYESFNARFWNPTTNHLFDVVDGEHGDDAACRPNQIFAISLPHAVLDPARWSPVLDAVKEQLLTPVGLRSLSPRHPDYSSQYHGNLRARDAAYHQGTVWAWLAGAYVDAWLRVHPKDLRGARAAIKGFVPHLGEAGVGSISEIFDAEMPFIARGCIAQAWSVAEVLRAWVKTTETARIED